MLNHFLLKGSELRGPIQWGGISVRGMVALFGVAATFSWVMGLMGYIRSAGRLGWHVNELMADVSPWAFTPAITFAGQDGDHQYGVVLGFGVFHVLAGHQGPVGCRGKDAPSMSFVQAFSREESV